MNVAKSHFDEDGGAERYRGTMFDYSDGVGGGFLVRSYADSSEEASFLARYHVIASEKVRIPLASIPYEDAFFRSVTRHLLAHEGKTRLLVLTTSGSGYEPIQLSKVKNA